MTKEEAFIKGYEEAILDIQRMQKTNVNDFGNQINGFIKGYFTKKAMAAVAAMETDETGEK